MNVGLYGKGLMLYSWDHKPRFTITRFTGDLVVSEKNKKMKPRKPDTRTVSVSKAVECVH